MKKLLIILLFSILSSFSHGFLFNLVGIPNEECSSEDGEQTGVCMSGDDCAGRGGSRVASCALGLGTCCYFKTQECGGTISQNCTHVQNDGFPIFSSRSGILCEWILEKTNDICFIRLDFKNFRIAGPQFDTRALGDCTIDYLSVNDGNGRKSITLCGDLSNQHMYLEPGRGEGSVTTMNLYSSTRTIGVYRTYDIKVSQIPCDSNYTPDSGCRMYFTGITGNVKSYNFEGDQRFHLNDLQINACVRQELGYCGIKWQTNDEPGTFSFSGQNQNGNVGNLRCRNDYVVIPGAHNADYSCQVQTRNVLLEDPAGDTAGLPSIQPGENYITSGSNPMNVQRIDRICGMKLTCIQGNTFNEALYTRTKPFLITYYVDENEFNFPNNAFGFSLNYTQLECDDTEL